MTAAGVACAACGFELPPTAKFCLECGAPIAAPEKSAEYKQVTVLFADVVHSMDIAAAVGPERLREIMTELLERSALVVERYGGTVNQFTGDGIMAVFGAPISLEDHALRACLTAMGVQREAERLAADVKSRDGVTLQLRIGVNSGQVIAGEIGSKAAGYTAIGEQVGMAQRMESAAPPGGVMLSESTARLVEDTVALGDAEVVQIKGVDTPVKARLLRAIGEHHPHSRRESRLVGRTRELNFLTAVLDEAVGGAGCAVNIVGPAGIGKSRLVREVTAIATRRHVAVFTTYCESHASDVSFQVISRILRAALGIDGLAADAARVRVREQFADADDEDMLLFDDLLGIGDAAVTLPAIAPEARRRRLSALINSAAMAQPEPAVYVVEDVHWIDEVSESMMAEFLAVIPQTPSLMLITSRPEYRGALMHASGAQVIALRPLNHAHASTLAADLLGDDPSLADLTDHVSTRAAGNPFFAEEIVRDLAERGVLNGAPGAYTSRGDIGDVDVPATLQATIGARIDRLGVAAKQTVNAAAVIGSRFDADLLASVVDSVDVAPLIKSDLVDQVRFGRRAEYAFRNPVIRAVAYESQLKSGRAQLHRRLAATIQARDPASVDEDAALIAEHLEAAGDSHDAFDWHMRAGTWLTNRDILAARNSWRRALLVADRLPDGDPDRMSLRIAARAPLCATAFRVGGGGAEIGFDELRDLCTAAGDKRSLVLGLNGLQTLLLFNARRQEASRLADELVALLDSIGDSTLTVALSMGVATAKHETGEMAELLRVTQRIIDLAENDPRKGDQFLGSPMAVALALRSSARMCLGIAGWKADLNQANAMARTFDPMTAQAANYYTYVYDVAAFGALLPDATALRDTADVLARAEQSGDDICLLGAQAARAVILIHHNGPDREAGFRLLAEMRERSVRDRFSLLTVPLADIHIAREKTRVGDLDGAVELSRSVLDGFYDTGGSIWCALATTALVEALVQRCGDGDLEQAHAAIDRLAAVRTDPGFVLRDVALLRLRALLARAQGDTIAYRDLRDRYRQTAAGLGFEGHISVAEAMP